MLLLRPKTLLITISFLRVGDLPACGHPGVNPENARGGAGEISIQKLNTNTNTEGQLVKFQYKNKYMENVNTNTNTKYREGLARRKTLGTFCIFRN